MEIVLQGYFYEACLVCLDGIIHCRMYIWRAVKKHQETAGKIENVSTEVKSNQMQFLPKKSQLFQAYFHC